MEKRTGAHRCRDCGRFGATFRGHEQARGVMEPEPVEVYRCWVCHWGTTPTVRKDGER